MSSFKGMTLKEAMPFISKLYESFGVKSMILLKDNEWINVVTVIYFTRRKVEDLNNEYRFLEERLGKIDYDNFKIILQVKPINEFQHVITELENGYLSVGELHTKLLARKPQTIVDEKFGQYGYVARAGEYAEYDFYSANITMDDTPSRILSNFGISASMLGLRGLSDLARSWLGLDSFDSSINIQFIIPIYVKVGEIQYKGGNEINAMSKMHERLFDMSNIWLTREGPGDNAPILERKKYDVASCDNVPQNGFVYVSLRHNFSAIGPNDRLSVSLVHSELGLLDRQEMSMHQLSSQPPDPLSQTFALFDAGKKWEEHLLNPSDDEDFVSSVSWLLERIAFRSLKLGRDETLRENKTEKGSADIIAHHPESKQVLVVDCTIGVPSEPKIDKIKNTADYISRKITFPVKPLIVTAKKSTANKELASRCNVKLINNTDLETIIGFYKRGYNDQARRIILDNV